MSKKIFAARAEIPAAMSILEVLARAKALEAEGRRIIHLEIGEPDFGTPQNIRDAAVRAMESGYTHYGPGPGLPEVREAIARFVTADRGGVVHPDQVLVTPGAKPAIFFTHSAPRYWRSPSTSILWK